MQSGWTSEDIKTARNYWSRRRTRSIDRRTRRYKLWIERRGGLVKALGRAPNVAEDELLDALTDRLIALDIRRAEQAAGVAHDEQESRSAVSEIRRLMMSLGLVRRVNDGERLARSLDDREGLGDLGDGA
jgi:hypothetical protein